MTTQPMQTSQAVIQAAQAVLDRWNSPKWDWHKQGPTADLMHALRDVVAAVPQTPSAAITPEFAKAKALEWHGQAGGELLPQLTANELAGILNEVAQHQPLTCIWTHQDDEDMPGTYASACGELWSFIDGGVAENNVRFCHGCGKPVEINSITQKGE